MTIEKILEILEENIAPLKLSEDICAKYKMYDNSGIIINCGNNVNGVLFTLDLSLSSVSKAKELGYNLIVTHHPAIYGGISSFDLKDNPQAKALAECIASGISVISMHLNFDAAPQGIDYYLMCGLGGEKVKAEISAPVQGGGYGRVYAVSPKPFWQLLSEIESTFATKRAVTYGDSGHVVKRVASFCGAGCDEHNIAFAKQHKADVFVSSDLKHHEITALAESGICVVQLTHYCAEAYGFNRIYLSVKKILQTPSSFYFDERFM